MEWNQGGGGDWEGVWSREAVRARVANTTFFLKKKLFIKTNYKNNIMETVLKLIYLTS
jgi:hypothetical protein